MSRPLRLFVAVPCGERLAAALTTGLDGLRAAVPLAWTVREQWHLTLQFLGSWPESRVQDVRTGLAAAAASDCFRLAPAGLGAFPHWRRPRVLFLQFSSTDPVTALADRVRGAVAESWPDGPQDVRPFRPHLTLARIKTPLAAKEVELLQDKVLEGLPDLFVEGFVLMSSRLEAAGAVHSRVAEYPLRKKGEKNTLHPL